MSWNKTLPRLRRAIGVTNPLLQFRVVTTRPNFVYLFLVLFQLLLIRKEFLQSPDDSMATGMGNTLESNLFHQWLYEQQ